MMPQALSALKHSTLKYACTHQRYSMMLLPSRLQVSEDTNASDTSSGKAKKGKKGAGQVAAPAASAPKANKTKLPTLNTVPLRPSRAPEPYLYVP